MAAFLDAAFNREDGELGDDMVSTTVDACGGGVMLAVFSEAKGASLKFCLGILKLRRLLSDVALLATMSLDMNMLMGDGLAPPVVWLDVSDAGMMGCFLTFSFVLVGSSCSCVDAGGGEGSSLASVVSKVVKASSFSSSARSVALK